MRILLLGLCFGLAGCARVPSGAPEAAPTPIAVSRPVERDVTDFADFSGRTAAVDSVEPRARSGATWTRSTSRKGRWFRRVTCLFEIDPLTYQAALNNAEGNLASMQARLVRLDADYARARRLLGRGAISREEHDKIVGDHGEAAASRAAPKAAVQRAKLDLQYTKVTAPVSGRVSRYVVTVGNLVQAGDQGGGTLLTTIVSVDPMYAYFDVDEHTVPRVRQLIREGKAKSARDGESPVCLGLAELFAEAVQQGRAVPRPAAEPVQRVRARGGAGFLRAGRSVRELVAAAGRGPGRADVRARARWRASPSAAWTSTSSCRSASWSWSVWRARTPS